MDNLVKGFDVIVVNLNQFYGKNFIDFCLKKHGNMMKASEMALFAAPVHIAISYGILMFYGENPALYRRKTWRFKR